MNGAAASTCSKLSATNSTSLSARKRSAPGWATRASAGWPRARWRSPRERHRAVARRRETRSTHRRRSPPRRHGQPRARVVSCPRRPAPSASAAGSTRCAVARRPAAGRRARDTIVRFGGAGNVRSPSAPSDARRASRPSEGRLPVAVAHRSAGSWARIASWRSCSSAPARSELLDEDLAAWRYASSASAWAAAAIQREHSCAWSRSRHGCSCGALKLGDQLGVAPVARSASTPPPRRRRCCSSSGRSPPGRMARGEVGKWRSRATAPAPRAAQRRMLRRVRRPTRLGRRRPGFEALGVELAWAHAQAVAGGWSPDVGVSRAFRRAPT